MHTVSAFTGSASGTLTNTVQPPIQDQIIATQNSAIFLMDDRKLLAAYGGGTGLLSTLLSSPTLLQNGYPAIYPIDSGALGGNLPATYRPMQNGLILPAREQIQVLINHTGAGPDQLATMLFHTKQFRNAPPGPFKTIQATATGANGNLVWSLLTMSLTQGLKRGRYACVGMAAQGTNLLAARLVFPQQVDRPGCMCTIDATLYEWDDYRYGNMGLYGVFDNDNLPQIECFGTGALSGTITIYLDIIDIPML